MVPGQGNLSIGILTMSQRSMWTLQLVPSFVWCQVIGGEHMLHIIIMSMMGHPSSLGLEAHPKILGNQLAFSVCFSSGPTDFSPLNVSPSPNSSYSTH